MAKVYIPYDSALESRLREVASDLQLGSVFLGSLIDRLLLYARTRNIDPDPKFDPPNRYLHPSIDPVWAEINPRELAAVLAHLFGDYHPMPSRYNGHASQFRVVSLANYDIDSLLYASLDRKTTVAETLTSSFESAVQTLHYEVVPRASTGSRDVSVNMTPETAKLYDLVARECYRVGWNADVLISQRIGASNPRWVA